MEKPNKMILEKLIEKIEFDKEKNIRIKLTFKIQLQLINEKLNSIKK